MMRGLLDLAVRRSRDTMRADTERAKNEARKIHATFSPPEIARANIRGRLQAIDQNFGTPLRHAAGELDPPYSDWSKIRSALEGGGAVPLSEISNDIKRNELRRELIAGSVQCLIEPNGKKSIVASKAESSGPPPYFKHWIKDSTGAPEKSLSIAPEHREKHATGAKRNP